MESGLQSYLREINETPLLTEKQEKELARRIRDGDASARDMMVRANLRLVVNIAKNYSRRGVPLTDLIEEGNLGLIKAVENFDADFGNRFSTYASWWIKQAIKRSLINAAQPIHIPAYMVDMIRKWKHASADLERRLDRPANLDEIAHELQMPLRKARIVRKAVKAYASRGQSAIDAEGQSLPETLADENTVDPGDAVLTADELDAVRSMLADLDKRSSMILRLRFGLDGEPPLTLKEIGDRIGLTRERVRQLERETLEMLHAYIDQIEQAEPAAQTKPARRKKKKVQEDQ